MLILKLNCFLSALLSLCILRPAVSAAALERPETSAGAMILYHAPSGTVLSERRADEPMLIASTTKLMTALVALEHSDVEEEITVAPEWTRVEGSSMYLRVGESYTVYELLTGLLLASGNDAALTLACGTAGSVERFADWMNDKAAELGLEHSHFANPHGLDAEDHYSCARDLAVIMGAAMEQEAFRGIVSQRRSSVHGVSYQNHNKLLGLCSGVNGGKTGYTRAAGRCLVSSCRRGELELICVTLRDRDDWADHCALYDWTFDTFVPFRIDSAAVMAEVPVVGAREAAAAATAEEVSLCVPRGRDVALAADLPRFIYAPVTAGSRAGTLRICCGDTLLAEIPLIWTGEKRVDRRTN